MIYVAVQMAEPVGFSGSTPYQSFPGVQIPPIMDLGPRARRRYGSFPTKQGPQCRLQLVRLLL